MKAAAKSSIITPMPLGKDCNFRMPKGFKISKVLKRTKPRLRKSIDLMKESGLISSRQKMKTIGIEVNSSQITSGGSAFSRRISARVHIGIPKINRIKNPEMILIEEREVNQIRDINVSKPAIEPNVPGAGKFLPIGPSVDNDLINKSIIHFLR